MKSFYITSEQAVQLGRDLIEYASMQDKSARDVIKGFHIQFGDMMANEMQPDSNFEVFPIPDYLEIEGNKGA